MRKGTEYSNLADKIKGIRFISLTLLIYILTREPFSFIIGFVAGGIAFRMQRLHKYRHYFRGTLVLLSILLWAIVKKVYTAAGLFAYLTKYDFTIMAHYHTITLISVAFIPVSAFISTFLWSPNLQSRINHNKAPDDKPPSMKGRHKANSALIGHQGKSEVHIPIKEGRHILATGTTGSGKTACISNVIESAMAKEQIVLVIDGKGDKDRYSLYDLLTHLSDKFNRKLYIIDLTELHKSEKYNPFLSANSTQIKDMLVNMSEWTEPHYKAQASSYWQIMAEAMLLADEPVTLHNMSTFSRPPELKDLINHLAKGGIIDNQTSKDWINIANQNSDTAADASARFAEIIHGAAGAIFSNDNNGIDMTEIYEQNACILVIINAQSYADFAYELGALVIQDIKKLIGHISSLGKSDRKHTLVVFDELGTYLSNEVLHIYNKGRSAGIQAVGMVQSLSDLEKNSPLLKNQIVENCNTFISFRTNDPDGADQISKIFGTEDSLEITHKIDGPYKSGSGTAKLVDKFKVHPNELKELPDNVGYVYVKGENSDQKPLRFTNRFVSY